MYEQITAHATVSEDEVERCEVWASLRTRVNVCMRFYVECKILIDIFNLDMILFVAGAVLDILAQFYF